MKARLFIRPLTKEEQAHIEAGLQSNDAFTLRRSQIIAVSARGQSVQEIAGVVGRHPDTVRQVIHAFNDQGVVVLKEKSRRPHHIRRAISERGVEQLQALLHRSPREFGKPSSLWTLQLLAEVAYEQGITTRQVIDEAIRQVLHGLGIRWKRAKHWLTSPDPQYAVKKKTARPVDRCCCTTCRLGDWLSRRDVVEPTGPSAPAQLGDTPAEVSRTDIPEKRS